MQQPGEVSDFLNGLVGERDAVVEARADGGGIFFEQHQIHLQHGELLRGAVVEFARDAAALGILGAMKLDDELFTVGLGGLEVGDVLARADDADDPVAVPIPFRAVEAAQPAQRAGLGAKTEFHNFRNAREHEVQFFLMRRAVVGMDLFPEAHRTLEFGLGVAEHFFTGVAQPFQLQTAVRGDGVGKGIARDDLGHEAQAQFILAQRGLGALVFRDVVDDEQPAFLSRQFDHLNGIKPGANFAR